MTNRFAPVAVLAAALFATPAFAQQSDIQIENAWSRAAMAGHTGVVFLTIHDTGKPDRLTKVNTPVAASAELHETTDDHGVMKMRMIPGLAVEPGKPVTLAPGGYHIMLMDLKQPLAAGQTIPLTLTFEHAGEVKVSAVVEKAGASGMTMDHGSMGGMKMDTMHH
jgi:copper(I)-binding protein